MRVILPIQLGDLRGWLFTLYRVVQPLLLGVGLIVVMLGYRAEVDAQANARSFYNLDLLNTRYTSDGAMVLAFNGPMKRVMAGEELLLAVDGRAIPTDYNAQTAILSGAEGAMVRLDLQRADGSRHSEMIRRSRQYLTDAYAGSGFTFESRHWLQFACAELASIIMVATALMLWWRRPHDPVSATLSVGLVGNVLNNGLPLTWTDTPALFNVLTGTLSGLGLSLALLFFPDASLRSRWSLTAIPVILLSTIVGDLVFWIRALDSVNTVLSFVSPIALGLALIARYRATPAGIARQQIKFAFLGFVTGLTLVLVSNLLAAAYPSAPSPRTQVWLIVSANMLNAMGFTAMLAGLLASLLRYRLYDADTLISRSAAYAALTLLLGAAFAASEKVIEVVGEEWFGEGNKALAAGAGAAVAATLIAPLHGRVHHWADARFQRALAAVRSVLPRRVADMREYAGLDDLLATVIGELESGVRAQRAAVLLADADGSARLARVDGASMEEARAWAEAWRPDDAVLERANDDALFPLRLMLRADGTGTVGWIVLGPRPDGTFYSADERQALAALADPVARAVHVILQRGKREQDVTSRIEHLERELGRLRALTPA
ncbi:MAG: hypothetical protein J0I47_14345 [Sphingomonas sp.]|uniref:hypothetical protein n=1 Tax=Sphingomonas sp. TaxID=28214 RepID=UPI001ACBE626|nr:hypothetical protein [Sphingomonas sp.]MBN8809398.1 hypothetical protein [Sphingomonas sp.]